MLYLQEEIHTICCVLYKSYPHDSIHGAERQGLSHQKDAQMFSTVGRPGKERRAKHGDAWGKPVSLHAGLLDTNRAKSCCPYVLRDVPRVLGKKKTLVHSVNRQQTAPRSST